MLKTLVDKLPDCASAPIQTLLLCPPFTQEGAPDFERLRQVAAYCPPEAEVLTLCDFAMSCESGVGRGGCTGEGHARLHTRYCRRRDVSE